MSPLEMYYYSENTIPTARGREKSVQFGKKYFLFELKGKKYEKTNSLASLEELAKEVANSLFFYSNKGETNKGFAYDEIILYRSLNDKTEGKPRLLANRNKVVVSGAVSDTDELYELQKRVAMLIDREATEEESDKF